MCNTYAQTFINLPSNFKEKMKTCPEELKDLFRTIYNLSDSEIEVFYYLCNKGGQKVVDIAEGLNRSRSTTQKILKTLLTVGIIERESRTYPGSKKGRYYVYSLANKEELKENVKEKVIEWKEKKFEVLDEL